MRSTPTSHVSLVEPIQLPPPFTLVRLRESGDAFAHACGIAPKRGAGTLVCVGRFDLAEFAVVLEPGELLSTARRAFYAGMVARCPARALRRKAIASDYGWRLTLRWARTTLRLALCSKRKISTWDLDGRVHVRDDGLERAIYAAGGVAGLARKIGISQPSVSNWNQVPAQRVIAVEAATGVSRKDLRPDLYGEPLLSEGLIEPVDAARAQEYLLLATLLSAAPSRRLLDQLAALIGDATPLGRAHDGSGTVAGPADQSDGELGQRAPVAAGDGPDPGTRQHPRPALQRADTTCWPRVA